MQLEVTTDYVYRPWDGRHIASYAMFDVYGRQVKALERKIALPVNDPLLLALRAVEIAVQAVQYVDADDVTIYTDAPAAALWAEGTTTPRRGYRQVVTRIRQRIRMLSADVHIKWSMRAEIAAQSAAASQAALPAVA